MDFKVAGEEVILITGEGTELTAAVAGALQDQGHRVVILDLPLVDNSAKERSMHLTGSTDQDITAAIDQIQSQHGQIGSFIHLHPHLEFQNGNFSQHFPKEKEILKTVFLLAKHLKEPLTKRGERERTNFLTVTRMDGNLGLGNRSNISILAGGLPGLVKSLNLEWPAVFCRAVDLQPEFSAGRAAAHILAEFHDPDRCTTEVGCSEAGRRTIGTTKVNLAEFQEIKTSVTSDSVFLVSGGARGVTATCVLEMAQVFKCKFILLGRSDDSFKIPGFATGVNDEPTLKRLIMNDLKERGVKPSLPKVKQLFNRIIAKREIQQTLEKIVGYGAQGVYLRGDVNDFSSFSQELSSIEQKFGPITGLIHGAGRLADKYIQDKSEEDFENVVSVKVNGLLNLLRGVRIDQLHHLILFSSVAGFYGNVGQTDYAMANEILNKAAHLFKRNHPRTQVSAINWGAWDSGMVSGELKAQFEAAGVQLVSSRGGAALLINELNTDYAAQAQVILGDTLPSATSYIRPELQYHTIYRKLAVEQNPFLQHHVIHGNPVLPVVNAVGWMAHSCEQIFPDFRIFKITDARLYKGIVFDGKQQENYNLELQEIEKTADQIELQTTVMSRGGKIPTYHYKARVTLLHNRVRTDAPVFSPSLSGTFEPVHGKVLYQNGALFHGQFFQGIEQIIDCTPQQMIIACKAPRVSLEDQGQFQVGSVNTFFADIQYQGMVVWVQKYHQGAKSLPLQTTEVTIYHPIPFETSLLVHIDIVKDVDFQLVANCTVYDEQGNVYLFTREAAVTISPELQW